MATTPSSPAYERDFYAWTQHQASALRSTRPNHLDWENIAEELEGMGRSEYAQMESRIRQILKHLLKWQFQPWLRTRSWRDTLWVQRYDLEKLLRRNPSLRPHLAEAVSAEYPAAVRRAYSETRLPDGSFPTTCPYSAEQVQDQDYLPQ